VAAAKSAGRRVIAVEDCGNVEPWDIDLSDEGGAPLLIVGAEGVGISQEVLDLCDEIVIIPMAGFYPCYNLQAPMAVMLVECLRQRIQRSE
jgi:tRNA G18 (ribose-2'-O)-methylase SpoU